MPKALVVAAAVVLVAVIVLGIVYATTLRDGPGAGPSPAPVAGANAGVTPPSLPTACGANPAPAVTVAPSAFGYRQLSSPAVEQPVSSPLRIAGNANPFEGAFTVTIFDRQGRRVATQDFTKDNRNLAFAVTLPFEVAQPMPACVWVHERSGRDGSATNITQVPVLLLP